MTSTVTPNAVAGVRVSDTAVLLAVGAANPDVRMTPSALVDVGWHAWVLHTVGYAEYCDRIGRFVHHVQGRADVVRAVELIKAAGFPVDAELWAVAAGDCETACSQCHAGCHDSP